MANRSILAPITPEVLRKAREISGYSINTIANKVGESPDKVENWENGAELPPLARLKKLSNYYKRPLAYFFLPTPPRELPNPADFRSLPTQQKYPLSPSTKFIIRKARKYQKIASNLVANLDISLPILRKITEDSDPEIQANDLREDLGCTVDDQIEWTNESEAYKKWRELIENNNIMVLQFPIPLEEARGFTLLGTMFPTIVVSSKDSINGKIFTLFHEYAHLLFRDEGIYSISDYSTRKETFCNHFSGAFLVPKNEFLKMFDFDLRLFNSIDFDRYITSLAKKFKVSRYVVLRRLEILGRITNKQYSEKAKKWEEENKGKKVGFGKSTYAEKIIAQKGNLYVSLVLRANKQGIINRGTVIRYLDEKEKHISALEDLVSY